ncbi:DUF6069 family protein [Micromonospora sp. NPDC002296]|uniref:DUF6069 family protein n=1 Tax=Micromonospora sp. NPDC002296 TaxID=3154271 RepID=UPI0033180061
MSTTVQPTTTSPRRRRLVAVAAAVLSCVVIWVVGWIAGVDYAVVNPDRTIEVNVGAVIAFALVSALLGWALLALLERFTGRAALIWTVVAVVVTLVSFVPVFAADASTGAKVALGVMHLAVAGVLIPLLPNWRR